MAIQRKAAAQTVQTSPEVVDVHTPDNTPDNTAPTGPVAVPDAASDETSPNPSTSPRRGRAPGYKGGPRLSWGFVVDGKPLSWHLIEVARQVSNDKGGYATLTDLLEGVKTSPVFSQNGPDNVPLSDLVSMLNLRNEWALRRDRLVIQFSGKPVNEGGLGLTVPPIGDETEKAWVTRNKELLTDAQWAQMEDAIARPKPEGKDFPKLVVRRGRRSHGLDMDDI